jgi:hypothetical protein
MAAVSRSCARPEGFGCKDHTQHNMRESHTGVVRAAPPRITSGQHSTAVLSTSSLSVYLLAWLCCHPGASYCCPAAACTCQYNSSCGVCAVKLLLQQQAASQAPETVYKPRQLMLTSYVAVGGGAAASIRFEASLLALLATLLSHIAAKRSAAGSAVTTVRTEVDHAACER